MTYDADGLRSTKQINGVKTEYQYVGDKLFYEKRGDGNSFYYFYDSYGKLSAIYHHVNGNKTAYHVVTNAQGDVIALYSWTGTKVAEYSYDAWGNCTIVSDTSGTGIATLNPFRYRSYYFDRDLGLYYLQSRYYDSETGRFINSDNVTDPSAGVMGYNTYVYCGNNPVMSSDPSGHLLLSAILIGAVSGALISGIANFTCQAIRNKGDISKTNIKELAISTAVGAFTGALSGGFGAAFSSVTTTASNAVINVCRVVTNAVICTGGDTLASICMEEEITSKGQLETFILSAGYSSIGLGVSHGVNKRTFNSLTKSGKRNALNDVNTSATPITNRMIKNNLHSGTLAYNTYLADGFDDISDILSAGVELFKEAIS